MVLHRYAMAEDLGVLVKYHMNNSCYKSFTMKRKVEAAKRKRKLDEGTYLHCAVTKFYCTSNVSLIAYQVQS